MGDRPRRSAVILRGWGLPSRVDAGLCFFNEMREGDASGLGAKDDIAGEPWGGGSEPVIARCPVQGAL
jgi:hypothetical protein